MSEGDSRFDDWITSLEARHLADLTFREVARALRALSSTYVERRQKLAEGGALATAGKRAAFALFYGPLHFLLVAHIVQRLPGATTRLATLDDLGCGTGSSSAAWATACDHPPRVVGIDRNVWALGEAAATYRSFGVTARTRKADVVTAARPELSRGVSSSSNAVLAAFTINELPDATRDSLLPSLLDRARQGDRVLIVEPIAGGVARWWDRWRREFEAVGGRADEWRFRPELPAIVAKLDRAAGLDHREITGRTLWIIT